MSIVLATFFATIAVFEAGIIVMLLKLRKREQGAVVEAEILPPTIAETAAAVGGGTETLEIDPENPPRYIAYNPVVGHAAKSCHCHSRELEPGEKVLWWPRTDIPGAVYLFCEETYSKVGKA